MAQNVPKWIDDLALRVRELIQKYDAMPRFCKMVKARFDEYDARYEKQKEWDERRQHHFEDEVEADNRLQDQDAGPPEDGWEWEYYTRVVHKPAPQGWDLRVIEVEGWCPAGLVGGNRPELPQLLPPARDHTLSLPEKYACLAAVHDAARRGAEPIAPWSWSGPGKWEDRQAFEEDKRAVGFGALCSVAAELDAQDAAWVASFIVDIEKDLRRDTQGIPGWQDAESRGKEPIRTVFLSSTILDLKEHRQEVREAIEGLDGYHCNCMEHFGARNAEPPEFCPDRVKQCDLFVGLVGHRYGSCPEGSDKSVTQLEYETAVKEGKPRLVFLAAADFSFPADLREEDGKYEKQVAFRQQVGQDCVWDPFRHPSDLALAVVKAIRNWETAQVSRDENAAQHAGGPKTVEEPLWITSFKTLRTLFLSGAEERTGLTHMMVQASDEQREKLVGPPKYASKRPVAFAGLIIQHPGHQLRDGRPARRPGMLMSSSFYGDIDSYQRFEPLARDAGRLLADLPAEVSSKLPVELPTLETERMEHSWMLFVHRVAWAQYPGSALKAKRGIWVGSNYLPYDEGELKKFMELGLLGSLMDEVKLPPSYFFSEITDNLFKASVWAIDVLLDVSKGTG